MGWISNFIPTTILQPKQTERCKSYGIYCKYRNGKMRCLFDISLPVVLLLCNVFTVQYSVLVLLYIDINVTLGAGTHGMRRPICVVILVSDQMSYWMDDINWHMLHVPLQPIHKLQFVIEAVRCRRCYCFFIVITPYAWYTVIWMMTSWLGSASCINGPL